MDLRALPELDPTSAASRLGAGEVVALDVREDDEWEAGRIVGSLHVPLGELVARQAEIPDDVPIVVVCRTGSRSAWATEMMVRAGYDAANLVGGLVAWHAAGLPLDPLDGYVA
jgi:rhodanese-related sulfurtransferase